MCQTREKRPLTPSGMVEAFHGEELAVDGVVRLVQHRAHRRHLRVCEYRIPALCSAIIGAPCRKRVSDRTAQVALVAKRLWTMGLPGGIIAKDHNLLPLGDTLAR